MIRYISAALRKAKGKVVSFRLKHDLYQKINLPTTDKEILFSKWPYVKPKCVSESFMFPEYSGIDLSICIPMHNVENCIGILLEQIEAQKTQFTYEVLLVNDGSTDNTETVVKSFIEGKTNYKLFSQENGGISAARNKAIDNATGNYLTFIDSDDEICEGFIEQLMSAAVNQDAEIVKGKYCLKRGSHLLPRGIASGYIWGVYSEDHFSRM